MIDTCTEEDHRACQPERRKILVVAKGELFTEEAMEYAVQIADRLQYDLFALHVGRGWSEAATINSENLWRERFRRRATDDAQTLANRALRRGVYFEHGVKFGDLGPVLGELIHEIKRIEFIVADTTVNRVEMGLELNVPIYIVVPHSLKAQGGRTMANEHSIPKKRPWGKTIGFGAITAALYAAVFTNADTITGYFAMGGWHAILPISTVFVFSFAHGAFASNLWSMLGVEAVKRSALRRVERSVVHKRKHARKRPRTYAYVNPFHRI